MASIFPVALYSGDPIPLTLAFFQDDGVTVKPITGITIGCTVKKLEADPDTAALYQKDIPGDATGIINFLISDQLTPAAGLAAGTYFLDIKAWDTTTTPPNQRSTILTNEFTVNQSITVRATP